MLVDSVDWHTNDPNFPVDGSQLAAATHIGFFVAWALEENLLSEQFCRDWISEIKKMKSKIILPSSFVWCCMDGKLSGCDFNDIGRQFSIDCYATPDGYLSQYEKWAKENFGSAYSVPETWGNFEIVKLLIQEIFAHWNSAPQSPRPAT